MTTTARTHTALVTGASSGIGEEFTRQLAAAGYHLVVVARSAEKLATLAAELERVYGVAVEVLPTDLSDSGQRAAVVDRLRDPAAPISLLINNAGIGLGQEFADASAADLVTQLEINVTAVMLLTHAALPSMTERGHGGIINVASIAGLVPGRGSTYSASKAWVIFFSEGLSVALKGSGVRVQALCPGFVRTRFHERAHIDMSQTPNAVYVDIGLLVRRSLADLRRNEPLSIPGALYRAIAVIPRALPRALTRTLASKVSSRGRT
ncbi:SDR family oxidoreductase [Nakamurella antarctica]|uniref:SDR family oxidoreductase n=1 Tax=Nakamurella antarctica TaxID=1902245 RepID=A0A3G8ZPD5_9ACTN|nr:SDR family oxidoreductase [Nakamurella antarctica]AZI59099.1 SDR family oxidoreductase [Nakamurella antarctica]